MHVYNRTIGLIGLEKLKSGRIMSMLLKNKKQKKNKNKTEKQQQQRKTGLCLVYVRGFIDAS